jgi:heme/copper-type cytochrome/quinol oxidase subunit 1
VTGAELQALERTWTDPRGCGGWFRHVDHKSIGRRYLITAFGFFLVGGMLAALMRLQLSRPDNTLLGPDLYNEIFTTHGTTMMFLFAVPVMQGLGIYFVPLMVGARTIAFPRLVAYSYWMFLFGGIFLYVSFLLNAGPKGSTRRASVRTSGRSSSRSLKLRRWPSPSRSSRRRSRCARRG